MRGLWVALWGSPRKQEGKRSARAFNRSGAAALPVDTTQRVSATGNRRGVPARFSSMVSRQARVPLLVLGASQEGSLVYDEPCQAEAALCEAQQAFVLTTMSLNSSPRRQA
jgi:hypothetical protein